MTTGQIINERQKENAMFLVVIRYSMDDVPLLLTNSHIEAMEVAKAAKPTTFRYEDKTILHGDDADAQKALQLDATDPICVAIYEFNAGRLENVLRVQDFTA